MFRWARFARVLMADVRAATAIEYGLILALITLAIIGSLTNFAQVSIGIWDNVADEVTNNN